MTDFKYNVGDEARPAGGPKGIIRDCYRDCRGDNHYLLDHLDGWSGTVAESRLSPIPTTPLDANGQEIGVGDWVLCAHDNSIGKVTELRAAGEISGRVRVHNHTHQESLLYSSGGLHILEKATPPQITLGSKVRVKSTGEEFHVGSGWRGAFGDIRWCRHTEDQQDSIFFPASLLELVE